MEVIPTVQLKRPRIDIVIACAAEGMFNNITVLMDKSVQKVKPMEEADSLGRRHYLTPPGEPECASSMNRREPST